MQPREALILGALLHDIGKFWQRTDSRKKVPAHPKWGLKFLDEYLWKRKPTFVDQNQREEINDIVGSHHDQRGWSLTQIVSIADRFSAGKREALPGEEEGNPKADPLISIFSTIGMPKHTRYYPTEHLALEDGCLRIFPKDRKQIQMNYLKLWGNFVNEFVDLPIANYDVFLISLFFLLQKYTWCVPSAAYKAIPDISLFDHLKTTAAISLCLLDLPERDIKLFDRDLGLDRPVALLVGGDLSGIQRFIYTISSAGVAKGLRGRSAYLQLLSDAVCKFVMKRLGNLPIPNLLYNSGGHFYILAPLTSADKIKDLQREISEIMLRYHHGDIGIVLEHAELTARDFQIAEKTLPMKWAELAQKLGQKKRRKFAEISKEWYKEVFGPFGVGGTTEEEGKSVVCGVCKEEKEEIGEVERIIRVDDGKCSLCKSFEDLGDDIGRADCLIESEETSEQPPRGELTWETILKEFGISYKFVPKEEVAPKVLSLVKQVVYCLNDTNFLEHIEVSRKQHATLARGFRFIGKVTPWESKGVIADFSKLSDASKGVSRWGVVRMDIDNLGPLFKEGFGDKPSISRISNLSLMLSTFFEGYINQICKKYNEFQQGEKDHLYVIYSGGDDLFIVGSWDKVVDVSYDIKEMFKEYVAENRAVTLSAGIPLHHKKFPLYKAADDAKGFLDASKKFIYSTPEGGEKNAITFLGRTLSWDEFSKVITVKNILQSLIKERGNGQKLSRGFLQKLFTIYSLYAGNKEALLKKTGDLTKERIQELIRKNKWLWRLVYNLAKEDVTFESGLLELRRMIVKKGVIDYLDIPVRWVELLTRKEEREK